MLKNLTDIRGFTLLELTLAAILTLPLLLGAVDVCRILQTQSVLNEAAKLTLRHLVTINGDGVRMQGGARSRTFEWFITDWNMGPAQTTPPTPQSLGTYAEDSSPSVCLNPAPGFSCERILRNVAGDPAQRIFDLQSAANYYAANEIANALPQTKPDCHDLKTPDCFSVKTDPAVLENGPSALEVSDTYNGDIKVNIHYALPLYSMWMFKPGAAVKDPILGGTYVVSGSASGRMESVHIDPTAYVTNSRFPQTADDVEE